LAVQPPNMAAAMEEGLSSRRRDERGGVVDLDPGVWV